MDRIKNEHIRGTAGIRWFDKASEAKMRCFEHVKKWNSEHNVRQMLNVELLGKKKRGRPKWNFLGVVTDDMQMAVVTEEDAKDRVRLKIMGHCGNH